MGQTANLAVNPALYSSHDLRSAQGLRADRARLLAAADPRGERSSPYKTLKDLVDAAKASPGKVNMASPCNGTIGHIGGELFQRRAGIKMTHIPYKGAGPAVTDLMGGSVDCYFGNTPGGGRAA